jgi:ssDNA thymidine ADP-ribosyltransferase DarT-like protein
VMSKDLNPTKALIFRIMHRSNVPWMLDHRVHCRSSNEVDPNYVNIGNPDLIEKRRTHPVRHEMGGTLSDYVPFYFTPFSPMMYNIKTGWNGIQQRRNDEIVILVSSLFRLRDLGLPFLFTDMHAYLAAATFYSDLADLDKVDWDILQRRDFKRDQNDLGKVDRYQAEALIRESLPLEGLLGLACHNADVESQLRAETNRRKLNMKVLMQPGWYF